MSKLQNKDSRRMIDYPLLIFKDINAMDKNEDSFLTLFSLEQITIIISISRNKTFIITNFSNFSPFFLDIIIKLTSKSSVTDLLIEYYVFVARSRELVTLIYPIVPQKANFKGVGWK